MQQLLNARCTRVPQHAHPGELWPAFAEVFAPEEIFFPTMLALAGYAPQPNSKEVRRKSLMFAKWPTKGDNKANPIPLDDAFDSTDIDALRNQGTAGRCYGREGLVVAPTHA